MTGHTAAGLCFVGLAAFQAWQAVHTFRRGALATPILGVVGCVSWTAAAVIWF